MRSYFNRLFKLLNLSGRDWGVLLLAILLAFSTWVIHKLSLNYSVYLKVEVVAESNIEERAGRSVSATEIMAKCRTTGWRILYSHWNGDSEVTVKFPSSVFDYEGDEKYYITTDKLHEYVDQIFGAGVSVEYFVTDKIHFKFQKESFKKVPVKAVSSLSFEEQYIATGPLTIVPDTVTVYGDPMHLESIDFVTTATIKKSSVNEDFSGMVAINPISGMRLSVGEVHYKMDVTRYLEVTKKSVPVKLRGVPADRDVFVEPSTVSVTMKVAFPLKSDPNKELSVIANYDDLKSSLSGQIPLELSNLPLGTIRYDISPVAVKVMEVTK